MDNTAALISLNTEKDHLDGPYHISHSYFLRSVRKALLTLDVYILNSDVTLSQQDHYLKQRK